jgi:hypothetical protein
MAVMEKEFCHVVDVATAGRSKTQFKQFLDQGVTGKEPL